ncbi:unnamed protein product [Paramecium primaurelia]|uniref:Mitochondrial import inner membrane translocase subunit TIM50 n=1 Tax=Paramecium primaurelia TaxID=5886 RepID=A0A8S1K1R9_PARPR|nr:unnamed protein product [Paramecium primaurelia]
MDQLLNFRPSPKSSYFRSSPGSKLSFQSEDDRDTALSSDFTPKPKPKPLQGMTPSNFSHESEETYKSQQKQESMKQAIIPKLSRFSTQRIITVNEGDKDEEPEIIEKESQQHKIQSAFMIDDQKKTMEEQLKKIEEKIKVNPKLKQIKSKPISMRNFKKIGESKQDKLIDHPFRHLIFNPTISEETFEKHLRITQRGLIYSKRCLKGPSDQFIEKKKISLNRNNPSILNTIFLDLDETLVHASLQKDISQVKINQINDDGSETEIGINIRPYTQYFLQELSQFYTVYIYTASSQQYASAIINYLDPKRQYISGILNRTNCMETKNGFFIKDLRIITDLDLNKTLFVDNLVHSFGLQIDNGIPILEWNDNMDDLELKYLLEYLVDASEQPNLREFNVAHMQLDQLMDYIIK